MRFVVALFLAVCFAGGTAAAAEQPLKVGILLELSGPFGPSGTLVLHGFQYYLQKQGGKFGGRTVETVIEDTAGDPATAITKVKKLVEADHIDVLLGPLSSATGAAVKTYVIEQKLPEFIMATVAELVDGHYMFRTTLYAHAANPETM